MNQEELDALIKAELENAKVVEKKEKSDKESSIKEPKEIEIKEVLEEIAQTPEELPENNKEEVQIQNESLRTQVDQQHKVIFQLDEVAKDSEIHANEVFEELEAIQDCNFTLSKGIQTIHKYTQSQKEIFEKLTTKFPNIDIFNDALEESNQNLTLIENLKENINACDDHINEAMNAMQFQDIHQQKINRVIHVIQSLVKYMNSLFESKEVGRAGPARHIDGDGKEDTYSQDEIEKLIESLGKNQ